jgi:CheY-like chemotaxis protein
MARILVIDDDALVRETIRTMLELEGHEVTLAPHAEEGLRHFRQQAFDLLICDLFTPRRGRTETVSAIRLISPDVPIIAMTGGSRGTPEAHDRDHGPDFHTAPLAGAAATIAKPFKPLELFALIRQCLEGARPSTR